MRRDRRQGTTCPQPGCTPPPCCRSRGPRTERTEGEEKSVWHLCRAAPSLQLGAGVPEVAQAKVSNGDLGVSLVQQDVFKLDVPVDDILFMKMGDPR